MVVYTFLVLLFLGILNRCIFTSITSIFYQILKAVSFYFFTNRDCYKKNHYSEFNSIFPACGDKRRGFITIYSIKYEFPVSREILANWFIKVLGGKNGRCICELKVIEPLQKCLERQMESYKFNFKNITSRGLRHNPFAPIVNSFSTGLILRSEFSCSCAMNTRIIIKYYKHIS